MPTMSIKRRRSAKPLPKAPPTDIPRSPRGRSRGWRLSGLDGAFEAIKAIESWSREHTQHELTQRWGSMNPPAAGFNLAQPRWAMALTNPPGFVSPPERPACKMLMGLAPIEHPPTDWHRVCATAEELFDKASAKAGMQTWLRLSSVLPEDPELIDPERFAGLLPGFGWPRGSHTSSLTRRSTFFDRRLARRRTGKSMPTAWASAFGSASSLLWRSGMSLHKEREGRFEMWPCAVDSIAEAMKSTGLDVRLSPGFFSAFPDAMDDMAALSRVDSDMLDSLRARWVLEATSEPPPPTSAQPSRRAL